MTFISVLRQTDILFELTITQLELVASICTEQVFNAGVLIFEENTPGTELYVIASGSVDIQVMAANSGRGQPDTAAHTIATLRRGQSFGEVSLVEATPDQANHVLGKFPAVAGMTWNNLALFGPYLLVRNAEEATCYKLPLEKP